MKYCVYCHTNKINGKKYIGITSQKPEQRWRNGEGYKNNEYFYRAIQKYGWHNFSHEILYTDLSKVEAETLEIKLIAEYNTTENKKGYNIEAGGNGTEKFTAEIKHKISDALKGHNCSEETKQKISIANKGKPNKHKGCKMSAESKQKNSICHLGQKAWNKGRSWSAEERAKCGGKGVKCVELNRIYRTAHEAGLELGVDFSSICKCRRGKAKTAGGYHWEEVRLPT
jgi:group I intron endonuclease